MNEDDTRLRELLQQAFRAPDEAAPERDLWPRMLRKLDQAEARRSWIDWVLAAAVAAWILAFPQVIPGVLYHL